MEITRQKIELTPEEKKRVEDLLAVIESPDAASFAKYEAASEFAYHLFIPWTDDKVIYGYQRYFIECNGPKKLIEAIKSAASDTELQLVLISACWNFSGSQETRLELFKAGAIPVATSFVKSPNREIFEKGIGWIWGFLEHEELLDDMARDGVIDILVDNIIGDPLDTLHDKDYRIFGCAQCAAFNQNCRTALLKCAPKLISFLLDAHAPHDRMSDILRKNHIGITLAYLANDERIQEYAPIEEVYKALNKFVETSSVLTVRAAESAHGYSWAVPKAFLPLIETDIIEVQRVGAFTLDYLCGLDITRQSMLESNMLDRITMLSYSEDEIVRKHGTEATLRFKTKQVPSLLSFAYWRLMRAKGVKECKRLLTDHGITRF